MVEKTSRRSATAAWRRALVPALALLATIALADPPPQGSDANAPTPLTAPPGSTALPGAPAGTRIVDEPKLQALKKAAASAEAAAAAKLSGSQTPETPSDTRSLDQEIQD